jgi:hypothetical protein
LSVLVAGRAQTAPRTRSALTVALPGPVESPTIDGGGAMGSRSRPEESVPVAMICAAAAFLTPAIAHADAGTALMWAEGLHLTVGNALIGVFEALILGRLYGVGRWRAIGLMILANYASAWLGVAILAVGSSRLEHALQHLAATPLAALLPMLLVLGIASYLSTILVEWPFVALAMRGRERLAVRSLKASAIVQTASYALLALWFGFFSSAGLVTQVRVDQAVAKANQEVEVYFVGPSEDAVYRTAPGGTPQRIAALPEGNEPAYLFLKKATDVAYWDLWAARPNRNQESADDRSSLVLPGFARRTMIRGAPQGSPPDRNCSGAGCRDTPWRDPRPDLRQSPGQSGWTARLPNAWDWAAKGMPVSNTLTGESYRVAFETPFAAWRMSTATLLPHDQVLFELRSDPPQVVLLDMPSRRIGVVAIGSSPLASWNGEIPERY